MAYANWAALVASESTANYTVTKNDRRSQWSAIAIHGGALERLTTDIVTDVATPNRYSWYALDLHDTTVPADNQRLRIQAPNFDEPQCLALQKNASYTLAVHAISDVAELPGDLGKVRVRGLDATRQNRVAEVLTAAGFQVVKKSEEGNATGGERGDALDPNNVAARNRTGRGVNIELDLTFRKTLVTDPDDLSSPKSARYTAFVKALSDYLGTYDKYNRWADLAAGEVLDTDYEVEQISALSKWAHIAIHGGAVERMTTTLAREVASAEGQKYWSMVGRKPINNADLHITSTRFDNPACVALVAQSQYCVSYHGVSDATAGTTTPTAFVGGLDLYNRDRIVAALNARGITAVVATDGSLNGDDPANIVNRTASGKGVQIELNRALRNQFVESGNASGEDTSPTTQKFADFVAAISSVVHERAASAADRPFDVGEFSTQVLGKEVTLAYGRAHQQGCQEPTTGEMFFTQIISDNQIVPGESAAPPAGARSARGDICVNRVSTSGNLVSRMWCKGFDHGASLGGVEYVGGQYYLWMATDATEVAIGGNAYGKKICRIRYVPDKVYNKGDSDIDIYDVFPSGSTRLAPSMDWANNRVGVYRRQGGIDSYRVYDMTAFRNKNFSSPIWTVPEVPAPVVRQSWCLFGEYIYSVYGNMWDANTNPRYPASIGNTHFTIIHAPTATLIEDHIRNTELALEIREPEALNIWDQLGEPKLMFGWSVSETLPRRAHVRTIANRFPYRSWQEVVANEDTDAYETLLTERGSDVSHLAIHGDLQELMTIAIAEAVAERNSHDFFGVRGKKGTAAPDNNNLLRIPSVLFDHPDCLRLQNQVEYSWSYHGRADDLDDPEGGVVYVGGLDTYNRQRTGQALRQKGFNVVDGGREGGGWGDQQYPANIVNRNVAGAAMAASGMAAPTALANGGGVQIEVTRTLRDRMSASGSAGDLSQGTTEVFTDFVEAIGLIAQDPAGQETEQPEEKCIRYFINDYNLTQSQYGIKLMQGTEWASAISPRRFDLEIPMWHGQVPMWHDPLDTMKVTFEVEITARSQSVLRQRYNDFVSLCGTGKWISVRLERYRGIFLMSDTEHDPVDNNRPYGEYASAQLESLSAPEYEHAALRLTTTAVFNVPAGQWRTHKIYTQAFEGRGNSQRCVVAKVSSVPVYSMIIRVQGGPGGQRNLASWSLVDRWSQTGLAWDDPIGVNLNNGEWLYCNTDNMRCYISNVKTMPETGESWGDFVDRINGVAAWSNFRYIRNGPLMLTHKLTWNEAAQKLDHTSGVNISMTAIDGAGVDRELVIQARAANR